MSLHDIFKTQEEPEGSFASLSGDFLSTEPNLLEEQPLASGGLEPISLNPDESPDSFFARLSGDPLAATLPEGSPSLDGGITAQPDPILSSDGALDGGGIPGPTDVADPNFVFDPSIASAAYDLGTFERLIALGYFPTDYADWYANSPESYRYPPPPQQGDTPPGGFANNLTDADVVSTIVPPPGPGVIENIMRNRGIDRATAEALYNEHWDNPDLANEMLDHRTTDDGGTGGGSGIDFGDFSGNDDLLKRLLGLLNGEVPRLERPPSIDRGEDERLTEMIELFMQGGITDEQSGIQISQLMSQVQEGSARRRQDIADRMAGQGMFGGRAGSELASIFGESERGLATGMADIRNNVLNKQLESREKAMAILFQLAGLDSEEAREAARLATQTNIAQGGVDSAFRGQNIQALIAAMGDATTNRGLDIRELEGRWANDLAEGRLDLDTTIFEGQMLLAQADDEIARQALRDDMTRFLTDQARLADEFTRRLIHEMAIAWGIDPNDIGV